MLTVVFFMFLLSALASDVVHVKSKYHANCSNLRIGQFLCPDPNLDQIDPETQQFYGCKKDNLAKAFFNFCGKPQTMTFHYVFDLFYKISQIVACLAADGIICKESQNQTFHKDLPCQWTNGYSYETTMLLSVFLGMFGADRFYLGYPAIGFAKLCTFGFLLVGQLVDVIYIATQQLRPADGSHYVIPYYGPGVFIIRSSNETYRVPSK